MNHPITILFPHSYLREQDIKKIFPLLGPITICQPWFMVPPDFMSQKDYEGVVRVLNPPSHLKPEENFKGLLSEYKTWIKDNQDKSNAAFLKVNQEMKPAENNTWEIREALRGSTKAHSRSAHALHGSSHTLSRPAEDQPNRGERFSLKWHLILHLARDMEKERQEADKMLRGLKEGKSPIADLLGEGAVKNPLTDLSQFESDPQTVSYPIDQVFEAWFGLFGEYIKGDELLITLSRQIMDYASEAWDTVVRENDGKVSPDHRGASQWEPSRETLQLPHKYFFPFSSQQPLKENKFLKYLSGKTMILVEEESHPN